MIDWLVVGKFLLTSATKLAKPIYTGSKYLYGYIFARKPRIAVGPVRITDLKLFYKSDCFALMSANIKGIYSNNPQRDEIVYKRLEELPAGFKKVKQIQYDSVLKDWANLAPLLPRFYYYNDLVPMLDQFLPKFDEEEYLGVLSVTLNATVILKNDWLHQTRANIHSEKDKGKQRQELTLPCVIFPAGWKLTYQVLPERSSDELLKLFSRESEDVLCVITLSLLPPDDTEVDYSKTAFGKLRSSQQLYLYLKNTGVIDIPITINLPDRKTHVRNLKLDLRDEMAAKSEGGKHFVMVEHAELVEQSWKRIEVAFSRYILHLLEDEIRRDLESPPDSS